MPLRAPKMYGFIFGFQRLVWCPKWTPASSRFFIVTSVIVPLAKRIPVAETRGPKQRWRRAGSLAHRLQEVAIPLGSPELIVEEFHRLHRVELGQDLAQDPHPVEHGLPQEQLFFAGSGAGNVHRGEDPLVH